MGCRVGLWGLRCEGVVIMWGQECEESVWSWCVPDMGLMWGWCWESMLVVCREGVGWCRAGVGLV